jgi:predicted DNA-binding protein (UPF0251 family)
MNICSNIGDNVRGPYRKRMVNRPPEYTNYKPSGIPRKYLKSIELALDEFEAIRLADYEKLDHAQAAEKMNISRPTFSRLIEKARGKVSIALIEGKELLITGGNIDFINNIHHCLDCGETIQQPFGEIIEDCPDCGSQNIDDMARPFLNGRHGKRGRK